MHHSLDTGLLHTSNALWLLVMNSCRVRKTRQACTAF